MKKKDILSKEELETIGYRKFAIGYHRFYCEECKGYVLVKSSFGRKFCVVCNEVMK